MDKMCTGFKLPIQKCIDGESVRDLSDIELLAVIVGTGIKDIDVLELSAKMIKNMGGLSAVSKAGLREIAAEKGLGLKKAVKIQAAFEIGRRVITDITDLKHISSPNAVWNLLLPEIACLQKEEFRVLVVNNKNMLLKKIIVSIGTITEAIVHPREVFRDAIKEAGSGIIVTHNHPSGNASPSKQDIDTTKRLAEAGKIVGIPLLDHIILTNSSYYSMKENGYII
ncbi:MAG TPA: DNA repair protein RadC [Spirochaetota bacterium]|nr:DNA repair protein RadC [Spirochaetota bacterium]HPS85190.1 DNA repair protein RadC [Spirochaetota bacterium]